MTEQVPQSPVPEEENYEEDSFTGRKKFLIIGITVIIIIGLGIGVYLYFFSGKSEDVENTNEVNSGLSNWTNPISSYGETIELNEEEADYDRDGLSDNKETSLGTDPKSSDTDSDGLGDAEEVNVYKTDPKLPDTDNDGYDDGVEVEGGYNPNGSGELFNTSQAITNSE